MMRGRVILFLGLMVGFFMAGLAISQPQPSDALSGSNFMAGRIIDDYNFFNNQPMTTAEIQSFLKTKVPQCDSDGSEPSEYGGGTRAQYGTSVGYPPPYICLKSYKAKVPARAADQYCPDSISSSGDNKRSAAQIIHDIAKACDINARVLIVTLQKEQALVSDEWPFPSQYQKAMGYGCPDSDLGSDVDANNNGCYDAYEGFFKQIYYAARQMQRYTIKPEEFNFAKAQNANILYNPNASCGTKAVYIQNHATAALYNYTPYTPNGAALNNLGGTGNACSSYGNR